MNFKNTIRFPILAALLSASVLVQAADLNKPLVLVAKPEFKDPVYGSTVLVVAPVGSEQHVGFIINRPTQVTLGKMFPDDGPSQKVVDPVYLGGPFSTHLIFALVQRPDNPGARSLQLMPGLYAAVDAETVDSIIQSESEHARFVAGFVAWRPGELHYEIEQGAWYVLDADPALALHKPDGLWEELVRRSKLGENSI